MGEKGTAKQALSIGRHVEVLLLRLWWPPRISKTVASRDTV
jgi:hypothetical protein